MTRLHAVPPDDGWDDAVPEPGDYGARAGKREAGSPEQREPVIGPKPQEVVLACHWVSLADRPGFLSKDPPPVEWALMRADQGKMIGVLPRGKVGSLVATGGVGKTMALIQLALAQALGAFWLGTFKATRPGHVLLALAEEDLAEVHRRLWRACNAAGLSPEERREVETRIHVLPLAGESVALTTAGEDRQLVETGMAQALRSRLEAVGHDWDLVIIDPLSRWAGGGAEVDNEAATRFVQVIETLSGVRGNPAVIVAHHSSKIGKRMGTADARGVTGIRDGFRWMAQLDEVEGDAPGGGTVRGVRLSNDKSNYSKRFDPLMLMRGEEPGIEGTLRPAERSEASALLDAQKRQKSEVTDSELETRVLATVARRPDLKNPSQIAGMTKGTRGKVLEAVKACLADGRLVREEGAFRVATLGESVGASGADGSKRSDIPEAHTLSDSSEGL
jgi:hypothetical protein